MAKDTQRKSKAGERPTPAEALTAVLQADAFEDVDADRMEIRLTASGHVTWRAYPANGDDYVGGVVRARE